MRVGGGTDVDDVHRRRCDELVIIGEDALDGVMPGEGLGLGAGPGTHRRHLHVRPAQAAEIRGVQLGGKARPDDPDPHYGTEDSEAGSALTCPAGGAGGAAVRLAAAAGV